MKLPAHAVGVFLKNFQRGLQRGALMNHGVEVHLSSQLELLAENFHLPFFPRRILRLVAAIAAGQSKVVDAGFANGHHFGVRAEFAQFGAHVIRCFGEVVGMPPHHGIQRRVHLGESNGALAAFEIGADGDDARYARRRRALDQPGDVLHEIGKSQMRVGIVKSFHVACGGRIVPRKPAGGNPALCT